MLEVVILAGGQGTRMKSDTPKVLHAVAGRPMLGHAIERAKEMNAANIVVVIGHQAEKVQAAFAGSGVKFAIQAEQLGTAHAFMQAVPYLQPESDVLVLYGDTPLIRPETLQALYAAHQKSAASMTVLTSHIADATGYGRIVRADNGEVLGIVEEKAATAEQKRITEFNSGVYVFNAAAKNLVQHISNHNPAQEYYLTDILALYREQGAKVEAFSIADPSEVEGANDRVQLAALSKVLQQRINVWHMKNGVTLLDPASTFIDDTVQIARDVTLEQGVILRGNTHIAQGATIGAYSVVQDSHIAAHAQIKSHSVLEGAVVGEHADAGPFARLRSGAVLEQHVHVGNFVEIKNSTLKAGAKAGHLAYLGDSEVGREANIGAGTITANYNGIDKHRTHIGDGAFIGSNSVLIAPVSVGDGAMVAAGSAIGKNIPEGALGICRAREDSRPEYALIFWRRNAEKVKQKHPVLAEWLKKKQQNPSQ